MANRKTYRYTLRDKGKIVYYGINNDLERREAEHRDEGKRFGSMKQEGPRVTHQTAENWEEQRLEGYRSTHRGRNPRYNDTDK